MEGLVVKSTGSNYLVKSPSGDLVNCKIKGQLRLKGIRTTNPVAVGDMVEFEPDERQQQNLISKIYDRKNYIIRKSVNLSKASQIIAANIDQVFLIASLKNPRTITGFIDRFLVSAEAYHVPASIIFNKLDIYGEKELKELEFLKSVYTEMGYGVCAISSASQQDIDFLRSLLKDKITLLSGNSGVGKSSIINALHPEMNLRTGDTSEAHLKGKHTTTFAEMFFLPGGDAIIDTPGIKSFGIVDFKREEVAGYFADFRKYSADCKFNNCTHINEPKCAVKKAVEDGLIAAFRYNNYLNIYDSEELEEEY